MAFMGDSGKIVSVVGREILDSRGNPTIEVDVLLRDGSFGRAAVPSGASTGAREAVELRDWDASDESLGDEPTFLRKRYRGKGVRAAVNHVNLRIAPKMRGLDAREQEAVDGTLCAIDGTDDKDNLGANAILGVSMAVARAAAKCCKLPLYRYLGGANAKILPTPMMNVLNGGVHSDAPIDFQELMIVPRGAPTFTEAVRTGAEIFYTLKDLLKSKGLCTSVGDEGGIAPHLPSLEVALDLLCLAIQQAGFKLGDGVSLALDAAASELYDEDEDCYIFKKSDHLRRSSDQMISYYKVLCSRYPIRSIEDGLDENDWAGWKRMTEVLGSQVQLVGDDLFVTNANYLARGIKETSANAILIKVNQIGTLTETLDTVEMAKRAAFGTIISHRSGETEDSFIADLAVATSAGQIKSGSLSRSDRLSKYNQLLRIEEELGPGAIYGD
jgi:enolase